VRVLASVMGVEGLPENDRKFLEFGDAFEERFVAQDGPRTLEESMALGWELLRGLPAGELTRLSSAQLAKYIETEEGPAESAEAAEGAEEELAMAPGEEGSGY
jgi:V/A-type H+-transporting ATPase subunit B